MRLNPIPGLKAMMRTSSMRFRRYGTRMFFLPSSKLDWRTVGNGTGSSTVMLPLLWIARTFPSAHPALWQETDNGQEERVRNHAMLKLLSRPNEHYSGPILWMATLADWNVDGNAYWLKLRDGTGAVKELWYVPSWMIEPRGDEMTYVDHYVYAPNGTPGQLSSPYANTLDPPGSIHVDPSDVIHFRFGLDADDPKKGYSPLKSVLREVFTDDEAANFTAMLLRNMGVPGLVVSPANSATTPEAVEATRQALQEMFTGDRRGEPLVMRGPTKVEQFGFSPQELNLRDLRRIPEERVSGALGVPAGVAGLGAGLDRNTFTNYAEARTAAYEQNIMSSQLILAEDIRFQLLGDFEKDVYSWRFGFDLANVMALQEAREKRIRMLVAEFAGGVAQRSEVRRELGWAVDPGGADDVYLQPLHSVLLPAGEVFTNPAEATTRTPGGQNQPPAPTTPPATTNGNDAQHAAAVAAEVARQLQAQGAS